MSAVPTRAAYWPVQLTRAAVALAAGLVITFTPDHSAQFGLVVFGIFAAGSGAILAWGSTLLDSRHFRTIGAIQAIVAVGSGVAAVILNGDGAGTLFIILIAFAAGTGFLELYLGLRARGRNVLARDWVSVGVLTALLALAVLLVPADYAAPWAVGAAEEAITGVLTSQIVVVGILGAYAILLGVYLVIGGLSARWATRDEAADEAAASTP